MKTAIILHGMSSENWYKNPEKQSPSHDHWLPWLQRQLLVNSILAQTPELPKPYEPNYRDWSDVFGQFQIDEDTILVGHSCGGGFLIRWLSENNVKVGKVILVAPWIDPGKIKTVDFFNFNIDPKITNKTDGITIFGSDNDMATVQKSIKIIRETVDDINYREFHDYGHFCLKDMKTREFPELLEGLIDGNLIK